MNENHWEQKEKISKFVKSNKYTIIYNCLLLREIDISEKKMEIQNDV